jgi:hypothetical protein
MKGGGKMKKIFIIVGFVVSSVFCLEVKTIPTADGVGIFKTIIETDYMSVNINCGSGARIEKLIDKKTGKNIVYWDEKGYGGLLDDRHTFTTEQYKSNIIKKTEKEVILRCEVSSPEGIRLKKDFIFKEGEPFFYVKYSISNHSYKPFRFWIRNFATPLGKENTEDNIYYFWQNEKFVSKTFPSEYQENISDGWFAIINKKEKTGFGFWSEYSKLDKFYFWQGSRIYPTCELIYKIIPEGKEMDVNVIFVLINGLEKVGMINEKGEVKEEERKQTVEKKEEIFKDIVGWKSLEEIYNPTEEEKANGFLVLSDEEKEPRDRLKRIEIDLGKEEKDFVPLTIFGLDDVSVSLSIEGKGEDLCSIYTEKDFKLISGNNISINKGNFGRLWLCVKSGKKPKGSYPITLIFKSNKGDNFKLEGIINIWNVSLPKERNIGLKPYAWIVSLSGEDIEKEETRKKLEVFLDNLSELRCNVCDWAYAPFNFLKRVKIKGTDKTLEQAGKNKEISFESLPEFDFSFYDPWIEGAIKRGMTRLEINVGSQNGWREGSFIKGLFPDKNIEPNSEDGWKIISHLYKEFKKYCQEKGMKEFWAKIDDEIPPEHIPVWNEGAKRYRAMGYKTYTTITGSLPRDSKYLNEMNPYSDGWQVAWSSTKIFFDLTKKGWRFEEVLEEIKTTWGKYTNGGAIDTWCTLTPYFIGEKSPEKIEDLALFADGIELKRKGGSGWGNKEKGVFMEWGGHLYVSLPEGKNPNEAKIEAKYKIRKLDEKAQPLVNLDPDDEIWFYGGGNYSQNYSEARKYGWFACAIDAKGYGYWTYWWWEPQHRLVWYDEKENKMINSPAYEGLRDGNEDAEYFFLLMKKLKEKGMEKEIENIKKSLFTSNEALLKLEETKSHIFIYDTFNYVSYFKFNNAKREILKQIEKLQ